MREVSALTAAIVITMVIIISLTYAGHFSMHGTIDIVGAEVTNFQGEVLGRINELVHDDVTGSIIFAILSPDRDAGIGEKLIPLPISALHFRNNNSGSIDISREKLLSAPGFEKDRRPDMSDRLWREDTYRFYGIRPHWKQ